MIGRFYKIIIRTYLTGIFFLMPCSGLHAQEDTYRNKDEQLANDAFKIGNYYSAIDVYQKILKAKPPKAVIAYQLAECYRQIRDYNNAMKWYQQTITLDTKKSTDAKFKYALMLKMSGRYDEAIQAFNDFSKTYTGPNGGALRNRVRKEIDDCNFALSGKKDSTVVTVEHLQPPVNMGNSDFAPLPYGNDKLIYSSLPANSLITLNDKNEKTSLIKLYVAQKNDSGNYTSREFSEGPFNSQRMHTANGTFSPDGKRFYFTRCEMQEDGKIICSIYVSENINGKWQEAEKLGEEVNSEKFTTTHPNVAPYKNNQEILFFVSDRERGRGGYDIWYSVITNGKEYSPARNPGTKINTAGNEVTPFYDSENQMLYFSSDGWTSFGGLDVFQCRGNTAKWDKPENIGQPVNSSADDFYYVPAQTEGEKIERYGYFVSNRPGGYRIEGSSETCCDDIYKFTLPTIPDEPKKIILAVNGWVFEEGDTTHTPIEGAQVLISTDTLKNYDADSIGKDKMYFFFLNPEINYNLQATAKGFFDGFGGCQTFGITESDTLRVDLYVKRKIEKNKAYVLKNIYFDFDKSTLRLESMAELDTLFALLQEIPNTIVEISAHTDNHGTDEYNIQLSQMRAESVVKYLIKKGIPKKRLVGKGYGERVPIAPNENSDGSDNPDGRQLNRRVEFKVIGELNLNSNR